MEHFNWFTVYCVCIPLWLAKQYHQWGAIFLPSNLSTLGLLQWTFSYLYILLPHVVYCMDAWNSTVKSMSEPQFRNEKTVQLFLMCV